MNSESVRLRIRVDSLEIDYQGDPTFLQEHLFALLEKVASFQTKQEQSVLNVPSTSHNGGDSSDRIEPDVDHTTSSIASRLSVKSGPDLIVAAAAKLTLVDKQNRFSRASLLSEMQTATSYYKGSYNNNLSSYLKRLEKADRLRRGPKDLFALSPSELKTLNVLRPDNT